MLGKEMTEKKIADRIDEIFQVHNEEKPEELRLFTSRLESNLAEASKLVLRRLAVLLILWVICLSIDAGIVEEGQVASFKIGTLQPILYVFPILLGGQYFLLLSSLALVWMNREAVNFAYKNMLPKVYELDVEYLLHHPNFITLSEFTGLNLPSGLAGKIAGKIAELSIFFVLFGGLAFLVHASWLVASSDLIPNLAKWISISVGGFFAIGAVLNLHIANENTKT